MNFWKEFLHVGAIIECDEYFVCGAGPKKWTARAQKDRCNFYFPDFFLTNPKPFFYHEQSVKIKKEPLSALLKDYEKPCSLQWSLPDETTYGVQYQRLYELLETGYLKKGVLYSTKSARVSEVKIGSLLDAALINKGSSFLYGFWDPHEGMIGVTPEILFDKNNQGVFLEALAGTRENEAFNEKEHREHQIVIDGIENSLSPYGQVSISPTRSVPYGNLMHLSTPIHLKTKKYLSFMDLVQTLHPTPALGTYPKDLGLSWLQEIDAAIPRIRYGAPVGISSVEQERCLVAIRNFQWQEGTGRLYAGGGVTIDSTKESEWKEILKKFNAIEKILNI